MLMEDLHSVLLYTAEIQLRKMMRKVMGRDFESCVQALEKHQDPTFHLGSAVKAMIADREKVLCGLGNGTVCVLTIGDSVVNLESTGAREAVSHLQWVGRNMCLSTHYDGACRLWDLVQGKEAAVLEIRDRDACSKPEYDCISATTSDNRAVLGSSTGNLRVWDLSETKQIAKVKAHPKQVLCMCVVSDSKCVTGAGDAVVKVWDLRTLQELATLQGHTADVRCLALTIDGKCVSAGNDGMIRVWDLVEYREVGCCKGQSDWMRYLKVIDANYCVACDDEVRVLSLKDFTQVRHYQLMTVSWEVQKNFLFVGTTTGMSMLDLTTCEVVASVDMKTSVSFVHYFDGKCACVSGSVARVVEVEQYEEMHELRGHTRYVLGALPCGPGRLVSWSADESLRVWNVNEYRELAKLEGHSNAVYCVAVTADGSCVSGSRDGYLKVWDLVKMQEVPTSMKHPRPVYRIAVTPHGKVLSGDEGGNVLVWSLKTYTKIGELAGHTASVNCIAVASEEVAITGSGDSTVRMWDLIKCTALAKLEGHLETIYSIAMANDGRFVSASFDKTVRVWSLLTSSELATLRGHTDVVWTVAVSGEKCVSGSRDRTIIVWNMVHYQQVAKFLCTSAVLKIVCTGETQFVSGHGNGEVKVWDECREIATLIGHTDAIWSLCSLENNRLASSSDDGTVKIWNLGQLSACLSQCTDRLSLEKEAEENKPVLAYLRCRIPDFKSGKVVPLPMCKKDFRPYFFNALHFCAYYNQPRVMRSYLEQGVVLLRGVCGSPLTLALERNTIECVDTILDFLISIASSPDAWKSFETIDDDLPKLLVSGSCKLEAFFAAILQPPPQQLPSFISPVIPLPVTQFASHPYVSEFEVYAPGVLGEELGKFSLSLVGWNWAPGSRESIELLTAAVNCEEKRVLLTDYFRTVIEEKWARCFRFTVSVAIAYGSMLVCLLGTLSQGSVISCIGYLILNGLFVTYEIAQLIAMKLSYFTEGWNIVDSARGVLGITWGVLQLCGFNTGKHFALIVTMMDFVRGFTHFRSFRMTRIFVYMTFTVVAEMYSFLIILAYAVFAFGIFTSILVGEDSLAKSWIKAYNMAMGNFDTSEYGALEWAVFTGATVTNIVVMMNLLISILGEAYEKAQMTMPENDLHMQASLVLEYETLMVWGQNVKSKMWVVTCRTASGETEQAEWPGKVLQIINSVHKDFLHMEHEVTQKIDDVKDKVSGFAAIEYKVAGIQKKIDNIEGRMGDIEDIKTQIASIKEIKVKIVDIEGKVSNIEEKLDTVLSLLQPRS